LRALARDGPGTFAPNGRIASIVNFLRTWARTNRLNRHNLPSAQDTPGLIVKNAFSYHARPTDKTSGMLFMGIRLNLE
jgi:hypothetical protein